MNAARHIPLGWLTLALLLAVPPGALEAQAPPDFLLQSPRVSLGVRAGYNLAIASSEVFDFTREQLTLSRGDFAAPSWGGQLAVRIAPRVDLALDVSAATARRGSEFRDWVDTNDLPIEQETVFRRIPVTLGVKAYLMERGRSVGRFAWIPTTFAPYVGIAAGAVWYRFEQEGDFVDYESLDIFYDRFTDEGKAPTVHVYGGTDWSLSPGLFVTAEARYQWAKADMGADFLDFDPMDLSGLQGTIGLSVRF